MNSVKNLSMTSVRLILTLFIISSCGSSSNQQTAIASSQKVEVIWVSKVGVSNMSDMVDGISYTTLKDHPQHRAYRIDKVLIENGLVYIFDYYSGQSLSVYNLDGNFQFAITKPGQGPDQYLEIQDFLVDKGRIVVLDVYGRLIFYNNQGDFEKTEKLPFLTQALTKFGDQYFFQTGKLHNELGPNGNSCELVKYYLESKEVDCVLEINNGRNTHPFKERNILTTIDGQTYYSTFFNDTIYSKQNDKFTPKFILTFTSNALPDDTFDPKISTLDFIKILNDNKDKSYHNPNVQGNSDFLTTRFKASGNNHLIYEYQKRKASIIKSTAKNDIDGGLPLNWIHTLNKRDLIMVIDSQDVLSRSHKLKEEKSQFNEKEQAFLDFASKLSIEDPLVMISYHLK